MKKTKPLNKYKEDTEELDLELDLEIRPATEDDFEILTHISRMCFPEQLRWNTFKSHNKKWWELLVDSDYCEIVVCTIFEQVVGYGALVYDRIKYEEACEKYRLGLGDLLYLFAACPIKSLQKIWTKLFIKGGKKIQKSGTSSKKNQKQSAYDKMSKRFANKNPWVGPIAVLPSMRRRGVATDILKYCNQRLEMHGNNSVYSIIKIDDNKSRELFEKLGFVVIDEMDNVVFYKKDLCKK